MPHLAPFLAIVILAVSGCTAIFDLHSAPNADRDNDTVIDRLDNCPADFNLDQSDQDADGIGDACDECLASEDPNDSDGDGLLDGCDACDNRDEDADGDGKPNNCDTCVDGGGDADLDGIDDNCDSCVTVGMDSDGDGLDDGCDDCFNSGHDDDMDGLDNNCDVCVGPQHDEDGDGYLDSCMNGSVATATADNCPANPNPDQADTMDTSVNGMPAPGDGVGDVCDLGTQKHVQRFDGFVDQRPNWYLDGAGWSTVQDAAHFEGRDLTPSYRSLPTAFNRPVRVKTFVRTLAGNMDASAQVFLSGDTYNPRTSKTYVTCTVSRVGGFVLSMFQDGNLIQTVPAVSPVSFDSFELVLEVRADGTAYCRTTGATKSELTTTVAFTADFAVYAGLAAAGPLVGAFDYIDVVGLP